MRYKSQGMLKPVLNSEEAIDRRYAVAVPRVRLLCNMPKKNAEAMRFAVAPP